MHLYRDFTEMKFGRDLLGDEAFRYQQHDLALARRERFRAQPCRLHTVIMLESPAIALNSVPNGVKELLFPKRLWQEFNRTELHCFNRNTNICVATDKHNRNGNAGLSEGALKL